MNGSVHLSQLACVRRYLWVGHLRGLTVLHSDTAAQMASMRGWSIGPPEMWPPPNPCGLARTPPMYCLKPSSSAWNSGFKSDNANILLSGMSARVRKLIVPFGYFVVVRILQRDLALFKRPALDTIRVDQVRRLETIRRQRAVEKRVRPFVCRHPRRRNFDTSPSFAWNYLHSEP